MRTRGFSLFEMKVCIAMVGILAAILLPALARSREVSRKTACVGNLIQWGMAFHMYAAEHDGMLPWSGGENNAECLRDIYPEYLVDWQLLVCPSNAQGSGEWNAPPEYRQSKKPTTELSGGFSLRGSYDYIGAYAKRRVALPFGTKGLPHWPLAWDASNVLTDRGVWPGTGPSLSHMGGGNILWLDGSVEFGNADDWADCVLPAHPEGLELMDTKPFARKPLEQRSGDSGENLSFGDVVF